MSELIILIEGLSNSTQGPRLSVNQALSLVKMSRLIILIEGLNNSRQGINNSINQALSLVKVESNNS